MRHLALGLCLLGLCSWQPAQAHDIPVNTLEGLVRNCTIDDPDQGEVEHHVGLCIGFIKGVTNALAVHDKLRTCPPDGLENGDLIEAILAPARKAPESLRRESSAMFIQLVLENAFPCAAGQ